jgi:hypothetical protein
MAPHSSNYTIEHISSIAKPTYHGYYSGGSEPMEIGKIKINIINATLLLKARPQSNISFI